MDERGAHLNASLVRQVVWRLQHNHAPTCSIFDNCRLETYNVGHDASRDGGFLSYREEQGGMSVGHQASNHLLEMVEERGRSAPIATI
jgi:hypothetical protein